MKSVKPGRGPSFMSGVIGIVMILFGIFWTAMAARFSGIMAVFGVLWTVIAVMIIIYNFKNATSKNNPRTRFIRTKTVPTLARMLCEI